MSLVAAECAVCFRAAQTGLYTYGSFDTPGFDTVDRGSLNVHLSIPVVSKQGRGVAFQYQLVYDSLVWTPVGSVGSQVWTPTTGWGLHGQVNERFEGYLSYSSCTVSCTSSGTGYPCALYFNYVYHDSYGVLHPLPYTATYCYPYTFTGSGVPSTDGSGYSYNGSYVTATDGRQINAPLNSQSSSGAITDTNGNYVSNMATEHSRIR